MSEEQLGAALVPVEKAINQGNYCPICDRQHSKPTKMSAKHATQAREKGITDYDYNKEQWKGK